MADKIQIPKTYKLYINGAFPRSERGRILPQLDSKGDLMANYCWATRKDFRNAMVAARKAQGGWAKRTAFNRSLIIYRIAETLEDRRALFIDKLVTVAGSKPKQAEKEVDLAIDRLFFFAGWADKFGPILSSVNPVAAPFFNFTTPEPTGVVTSFVSKKSALLGLVSAIAPVIVSGNTSIAIVENIAPTIAIDFAEVIAVSDVPGGVINILTGKRDELVTHTAGHMDLNAISYYGGGDEAKQVEMLAADNVKRVKILPEPADWLVTEHSLYDILPFIEFKTAWHPVGQ